MFMFVAIFSIWCLILLGGSQILDYPIHAQSLTSFLILSPLTFQGGLSSLLLGIWLLWGIALFTFLLKAFIARRSQSSSIGSRKEHFLLSLGAPGNTQLLDIVLAFFCLLLLVVGWVFGQAASLLIGTQVALGLFGNYWEHRLS